MHATAPNGILDDNGRLLPEVLAARRRGIWFDVGNGLRVIEPLSGGCSADPVQRILFNGSCSMITASLTLSLVAGSGPRCSANARSSMRRPYSIPGRP